VRRLHAAAGVKPGALAANTGERGLVGGADTPGVDLAVGPYRHRERHLRPLLIVREEGPQRQGDARRHRLHLEHDSLALLPPQGDDGVTGRAPGDVVGAEPSRAEGTERSRGRDERSAWRVDPDLADRFAGIKAGVAGEDVAPFDRRGRARGPGSGRPGPVRPRSTQDLRPLRWLIRSP
jgi:hypothetical protein